MKSYFAYMKELKELISSYMNFPRQGIEFKDVIGIAQEPEVFKKVALKMSSTQIIRDSEAIIAIDARGFVFGSVVSLLASKPMVVARKPNKLPGKIVERQYSLEYGNDTLSIQKNVLEKYQNFAIIDDLLATGGTANCVSEILVSHNKVVRGLVVVVELEELAENNKFKYPVESLIKL